MRIGFLVLTLTVSALCQAPSVGVTLTRGAISVTVMQSHPAALARFMPVLPEDVGVDWWEVFVSSNNPATAGFRVTITVQDGTVITKMSQEIPKAPTGSSVAIFKVPIGVKIVAPIQVSEISATVEFR